MSSWTRLNFIVEGQTESDFVTSIIKPHFTSRNIAVNVRIVMTSRDKNTKYCGGGTYQKRKSDIQKWLKQEHDSYLTTMFDYYGFPHDLPGIEVLKKINTPVERATKLEELIATDVNTNPKKLIPYIQLHEFEGLLFSDIARIDSHFVMSHSTRINDLETIIKKYTSPEHINDKQETSPSNRIKNLYSDYDKRSDGILIANNIGLQKMREKCQHFDSWLAKLESIS